MKKMFELYVTGLGLVSNILRDPQWNNLNRTPSKISDLRWNLFNKISLHIVQMTYVHKLEKFGWSEED